MIGEAGRPVRVVSLSGGGLGTMMQLGVTHALVVMRAEPPDVVAGVSLGAVQATALVEVLQAGDHLATPEARYQKQMERLTSFIDEELSAPVRLISALLPDAYQVRSRAPFAPLRTPTQSKIERKDREKGVRSRLELIRLINDLVSIDIKVATLTRLVRAFLGYRAAGDASTATRARAGEAVEAFQICWVSLQAIIPLATLTRRIQTPIFGDLAERAARALRLGDLLKRSRRGAGRSASQIMNRSRTADRLVSAVLWVTASLINAALWIVMLLVTAGLFLRFVGTWIADGLRHLFRRGRPEATARPIGPPPAGRSLIADLITKHVIRPVLRGRELDDSLLEPEVLRTQLIRIFDQDYYGAIGSSAFDEAVGRSFGDDTPPSTRPRSARTIGRSCEGRRPIHLGIAAANLSTGELELLPGETAVVDALLAATADLPWFKIQPLRVDGGWRWFFSGLSISRDPTQVVLDLLRKEAVPGATGVLVYVASHLTSANQDVNAQELPFPTWVEVARRANDLKKLRDARLEWKLTELVSQLVPPNAGSISIGAPGGQQKAYLRVRIDPIEPEETLNLGEQISDATDDLERETVILTAIAKGCRATMETLLKDAIAHPPSPSGKLEHRGDARCRAVVRERLAAVLGPSLPDAAPGPGVSAVCRHCTCRVTRPFGMETLAQSLRAPIAAPTERWVDWPIDARIAPSVPRAEASRVDLPPFESARPRGEGAQYAWPLALGAWPQPRCVDGSAIEGRDRPLVSLLFSGGVFRGVYLVGVVTALCEMGVRPDLIAGASVGSVTAILAADALAQRDPGKRALQMARFASVFLALDRFILTDTFADFIRTFTLRAAQSDISLRDVDRVLRRFDEGNSDEITADLRRVTASLERLFYFTAFEFVDVVRAFRYGRTHEARVRLTSALHKWLSRDGAQWEVLGADPLSRIMGAYVLDARRASPLDDRTDVPFQAFLQDGIYLLATATNLTRGQLELLGDVFGGDQRSGAGSPGIPPSLLEGVLASSAFPGIFRPRWSWEVFPGQDGREQFTDGGVMDNLPLDAVAHFIHSASLEQRVKGRPQVTVGGEAIPVPHLLFTASLESDTEPIGDRQLRALQRDWWQALVRIKQLGVNRKIDSYRSAQRHLRAMFEQRQRSGWVPSPSDFVPADLEVVDVRPRWLCSTFGFHPMMGFRRQRQAESIAHGCATTFVKWQVLAQEQPTERWMRAWGIDATRVASNTNRRTGEPPVPRTDVLFSSGRCVFRQDAACPYSAGALAQLDLPAETRQGLEEIYRACRRPGTHLGPADVPGVQGGGTR